jgi:hypothetical protein
VSHRFAPISDRVGVRKQQGSAPAQQAALKETAKTNPPYLLIAFANGDVSLVDMRSQTVARVWSLNAVIEVVHTARTPQCLFD